MIRLCLGQAFFLHFYQGQAMKTLRNEIESKPERCEADKMNFPVIEHGRGNKNPPYLSAPYCTLVV